MNRPEAGFTLIELLVVVVILGVIGFGLTQAVILGLKTTNGTANRVSGSSAVEVLTSYYFGDVQSASQVSTTVTSTTDTADCGTMAGVIVHLAWVDQNTATDVFYTFDPPSGRDQNLVRVRCTGTTGAAERRILGHFSRDTTSTEPVTLSCGETSPPPPSPCADPLAVTLSVQSDPAAPLTALSAVRRISP